MMKSKGTTLIETLIYLTLLSLLITGVFSSVYIIIHSADRDQIKNDQDTDLLLKNYHE